MKKKFKDFKINYYVSWILVIALIVKSPVSLVAAASELNDDDVYAVEQVDIPVETEYETEPELAEEIVDEVELSEEEADEDIAADIEVTDELDAADLAEGVVTAEIDEAVADYALVMPLSLVTGGTVLAGDTVTIDSDVIGDITVQGTLILDGNFTITGTVTVNNGGTFNMSDGRITGTDGRGVLVTGAGTVFNMFGGAIEGNILATSTSPIGSFGGAGVLIQNNATFNMYDGIISGNEIQIATTNLNERTGGGVNVNSGSFYMHGGIISGNSINGPNSRGGGVAVGLGATFNMSGDALISDNRLNGSNGEGGGVRVQGIFNMSGGTISGNRTSAVGSAITGFGGGVNITSPGTFNMSGDALIDSNIANHGGGINVGLGGAGNDSTFNMSGAAVISNNGTPMLGWSVGNPPAGGGVRVDAGHFNMSGGRIVGNSLARGGGVALISASNSHFEMTGGIITENQSFMGGGSGGGVYWSDEAILSRMIISDDATIVNNIATGAERIQNRLNNEHNIEAGGRINPAPWSGTANDHAFNGHDIRTTLTIINFQLHGGTGSIPSQLVEDGGLATAPTEVPTRTGYRFIGWFAAANGDVEFDFDSPIMRSLIGGPGTVDIHAQWELIVVTPIPVIHNVTFNLNGGTGAFPVQEVEDGELATAPTAVPTREGYSFAGWFTTATGNLAFDFTNPITEDTDVHAQWELIVVTPVPVTHNVTFNLNGGTGNFPVQEVEAGELATAPTAVPTREGYRFTGWFTTATGNVAFDFTNPITEDVDLHAQWEAIITTPDPDPDPKPDLGTRPPQNNNNNNNLPQTGAVVGTSVLAGLALATTGTAMASKKKRDR